MAPQGTCAACHRPLAVGVTVRLWDGKDYCRECVERACPGLADYAATHDRLEETTPRALGRRIADVVSACLLANGFFVLLFWLAGAAERIAALPPAQARLLIYIIIGMFVVADLLIIAGQLLAVLTMLPAVSAGDGDITVVRPGSRPSLCRQEARAPLSECRWFIGRWCGPAGALPSKEPAIVLALPVRILGRHVCNQYVTCGFTPRTRRLWEGFLKLAGVPQTQPPWYIWRWRRQDVM